MDVELKTRILELVEEKFPGWKGFEDPRFVEEEIDYKKAAIKKAQEELGREVLQRLLDREDFEEIIKRIDADPGFPLNLSNVLNLFGPSFDLGIPVEER